MPGGARLAAAFASRTARTGLIPYLTAGYPSLDASLAMLEALESAALAIEVGVPFSDPIADGPDIQRSSEHALRGGVSVDDVLDLVARYRRGGSRPVVLMTYANPVARLGYETFASRARDAGVDGVIVSDLPPEEAPEAWSALDAAGLDTVLLVAPTTPPERLARVVARCRGFVYCLARTGVTGAGGGEGGALDERIARIRTLTPLPVGVGFGIATAEQARALNGVADAVIVGAALMREIAADPERGAVERVAQRAHELKAALT